MTEITHGPDGPRFDGMTVDEIVAGLESAAATAEDFAVASLLRQNAAAIRHLSGRVAELEAMPKLTITHSESRPFDVRELLAEYDDFPPGPMEATP